MGGASRQRNSIVHVHSPTPTHTHVPEDILKPRILRKCKLAVSGGMGQGEGGEGGSCTRTSLPPPPVSFSYKKLLDLRQMCFAFCACMAYPPAIP